MKDAGSNPATRTMIALVRIILSINRVSQMDLVLYFFKEGDVMFVSACIIILAILVLIFIILCKLYISMLMVTGLSRPVARFQVFSAFTNSGFTSGEAELIMYDRLRRKICLAAMITGYIFSTLIIALVVGVVAGLNFKDNEYNTVYWERIFIVLGITVGIFILFILMTKIRTLRNFAYEFLKKVLQPDAIMSGNPITYENLMYNIYIAQVEINILRPAFKETQIGKIDFAKAGITILLLIKKDGTFIDKKHLDSAIIEEGDKIQVCGSAKDIEKVFSMR